MGVINVWVLMGGGGSASGQDAPVSRQHLSRLKLHTPSSEGLLGIWILFCRSAASGDVCPSAG